MYISITEGTALIFVSDIKNFICVQLLMALKLMVHQIKELKILSKYLNIGIPSPRTIGMKVELVCWWNSLAPTQKWGQYEDFIIFAIGLLLLQVVIVQLTMVGFGQQLL